MEKRVEKQLEILVNRYPELSAVKKEISEAYQILENCYAKEGKLLAAGNGGSAADAEHIVGELMKGFKLPRKPEAGFADKLVKENEELGTVLAESLQGALPAIAYPYEKTIFADIFKTTFNEGGETFGDYALNLFYFTRELDRNVKEKGISRIGFLARGGYFLKECLDRYEQILMPTEMNTYYVKNSRKVNRMAEKSRDDEILLKKYLKQFSDGNYLCLVDEGWYCSSQILMQKKLGFDIDGYYLGIMGRKNEDADCRRKGILFDTDGNGQSPLFGVFRTNCTFYEQILSAPHGSTVAYKEVNGKIQAVEKWHEKEKENYEERINKIQNVILDYLTGITSWVGQGTTLTKYTLACFVLRQLMFGSSKRILTENEILGSWYDNANDTADKKFASIKNVHVKMDVFYRPENYLRYFCKLKTLTLKHPAMKIIYPVLGRAIYLYCRISIFFKYRNVR